MRAAIRADSETCITAVSDTHLDVYKRQVSATPSNKSIVHRAIKNASDIPEKFTNSQYEEAIQGGVILFSKNSDGQIWFDSGVTTLTILDENQDAGWKKLKRTKVRNELMHRLDPVSYTHLDVYKRQILS